MSHFDRTAIRLAWSLLVSVGALWADVRESSALDWQLQGDATLDGTSVVLTQGVGDEAGSAFVSTPYTLGARSPWSIWFTFRIDESATDSERIMGDGLTVVLADSPELLGNGGSDLGVFGAPEGNSHYVFGVDTFNFGPSDTDPGEPPTPSVFHSLGGTRDFGTFYNNSPISYSDAPVGEQIRGRVLRGIVTYLPLLNVDLGGGNVGDVGHFGFLVLDESDNALFAPVVGKAVVLPAGPHPVLDSPLYLGFTAGNGLATDRHTILSAYVITLPEPAAWQILGLASVLALVRRNHRGANGNLNG